MSQTKRRKRKASKKKSRKASNAYSVVPAEIRQLISERHILATENVLLYDSVFTSLVGMYPASHMRHWFLIKSLQDSIWAKLRMLRITPGIIDSARMQVMKALFESLPYPIKAHLFASTPNVDLIVLSWFADPAVKKQIAKVLAELSYTEAALEGMAFVARIDEIERLERLQSIYETREKVGYRLLEEERPTLQLPVPANDDQTEPAALPAYGPGDEESEGLNAMQFLEKAEEQEAGANNADTSDPSGKSGDHNGAEDSAEPEDSEGRAA